jgi:hypothetical protein
LPLTLTGALAQDAEVIETGIFAILRNDQKGRGVLFFDRIRAIPPLAPREAVVSAVVVLKKEFNKMVNQGGSVSHILNISCRLVLKTATGALLHDPCPLGRRGNAKAWLCVSDEYQGA